MYTHNELGFYSCYSKRRNCWLNLIFIDAYVSASVATFLQSSLFFALLESPLHVIPWNVLCKRNIYYGCDQVIIIYVSCVYIKVHTYIHCACCYKILYTYIDRINYFWHVLAQSVFLRNPGIVGDLLHSILSGFVRISLMPLLCIEFHLKCHLSLTINYVH